MDDDVYPNSGQPFMPLANPQKLDNEKERNDLLDQLPLIKRVYERLQEKITFYDTLNSIQVDISVDPETFQKVFEANKLTKSNLMQERDFIKGILDKHKR